VIAVSFRRKRSAVPCKTYCRAQSDVGCLLAPKEAHGILKRPSFSVGIVHATSVQGDGLIMQPGGSAFRGGTLYFLGIQAVEIGLNHLDADGMDTNS
jgi:selenocysteine lyase/cysteine desulfurase